jgi:hypothetical protein
MTTVSSLSELGAAALWACNRPQQTDNSSSSEN